MFGIFNFKSQIEHTCTYCNIVLWWTHEQTDKRTDRRTEWLTSRKENCVTSRSQIFQKLIIRNAYKSRGIFLLLCVLWCIRLISISRRKLGQPYEIGKCDRQIDKVITIGRDHLCWLRRSLEMKVIYQCNYTTHSLQAFFTKVFKIIL